MCKTLKESKITFCVWMKAFVFLACFFLRRAGRLGSGFCLTAKLLGGDPRVPKSPLVFLFWFLRGVNYVTFKGTVWMLAFVSRSAPQESSAVP